MKCIADRLMGQSPRNALLPPLRPGCRGISPLVCRHTHRAALRCPSVATQASEAGEAGAINASIANSQQPSTSGRQHQPECLVAISQPMWQRLASRAAAAALVIGLSSVLAPASALAGEVAAAPSSNPIAGNARTNRMHETGLMYKSDAAMDALWAAPTNARWPMRPPL